MAGLTYSGLAPGLQMETLFSEATCLEYLPKHMFGCRSLFLIKIIRICCRGHGKRATTFPRQVAAGHFKRTRVQVIFWDTNADRRRNL